MLINVLILYLNLFSYEKNHFISSDWELKKEENNIKVYLRKNESNNVEYLAETVINTNIDSILEIILDYDNSHKWMYKLEDSRIIEKKYDSLFYVYFTMEMGWPLKKRDLVSDVKIDKKDVLKLNPQKKIQLNLYYLNLILPNSQELNQLIIYPLSSVRL